MSKPKGKIPSLIGGSNGKPILVVAGKKCHDDILKSEKCSDIPNLRSPFSSSKRYCISCYKLILKRTVDDVAELERGISLKSDLKFMEYVFTEATFLIKK